MSNFTSNFVCRIGSSRYPDLEKFDCHEAKERRAGDEQDEDVDNVRKSVPGVPEGSPDLAGFRKINDQERSQWPEKLEKTQLSELSKKL